MKISMMILLIILSINVRAVDLTDPYEAWLTLRLNHIDSEQVQWASHNNRILYLASDEIKQFDLQTSKSSVLLDKNFLDSNFKQDPQQSFSLNLRDIQADKKLDRLALNLGKPMIDRDAGYGSEIVVYDFAAKKFVLRKFDNRYHTDLIFSNDGRYLAYASHSALYFNMMNDDNFPIHQVEVFDFVTSKTIVLAPESGGHISSGFIWSEDSKRLAFLHSSMDGKSFVRMLTVWVTDTGAKINLKLKNPRDTPGQYEFLPDHRLVTCNGHELAVYNPELTRKKVLYDAVGLATHFSISGNEIRFDAVPKIFTID